MSDDRRDAHTTSEIVLPSHPVELGESDMEEASRSVSPEVRQARSEARDPSSAGHHHQGAQNGHHDSTSGHTSIGLQQKAEGGHHYGEGYTSDGIPPALNLGGYNESTPAAATADSAVSNNQSFALQKSVPPSTDHGIADTTTAETTADTERSASPVSPSKSENRGFFSRILGGFMPGSSEPVITTPQEPPSYLTSAPSLSWGKPTDTADIEVVKEQGLEKADETGLDPATATKLAGLDSAAAYNKHEPAVAAAEVLAESKADAHQETVAASKTEQSAPHSPGRDSEVYTTPQTSPDKTHGHSSDHVAHDSTQPRDLVESANQDTGAQAPDSTFHDLGSSLRRPSFESKPISGEGWTRHDTRASESPYSGAIRQDTVTPPTAGSHNPPHGHRHSNQSARTADRELDSSAVARDESVRESAPAAGHGQASSQPETVNTTVHADSEPQTQAHADTDSNQGVFSKLAAAVGLGGNTEESSQAQTGYTGNEGGYSGNQAGSPAGYTGNQYSSGTQQGTGTGAGTGSDYKRTYSNLPPSASWGTAAKYEPETVTSDKVASQAAPTAAGDGTTGYQTAAATDSSIGSGSGTHKHEPVSGDKSVEPTHSESAHAKQPLTESAPTVPAHIEPSHTESAQHGKSADSTAAGTAVAGAGAAATGAAATGNDTSYTDAGRRDTPVEQSSEAFTADTAPATQSAVQSDIKSEVKPEPKIGTTAAEHASSPRHASNTPSAFKESSAGAEPTQTAGETKPPVAFGTTAAEHALRRTSGTPLSRESAESVPPTSGKKLAATPEAGTAGAGRSTADLPVSTNAPPASARTTQEEPAAATAGKAAGLNGNAAPSTAVASGAEKAGASDASKGIGSQGKPAVPSQAAGKTANTGKHNGFLACFTCGQKSTVE